MAAYRRVDDLRSPAGWLPVHRDQLRAQRSVSSMGKHLPLLLPFTCMLMLMVCKVWQTGYQCTLFLWHDGNHLKPTVIFFTFYKFLLATNPSLTAPWQCAPLWNESSTTSPDPLLPIPARVQVKNYQQRPKLHLAASLGLFATHIYLYLCTVTDLVENQCRITQNYFDRISFSFSDWQTAIFISEIITGWQRLPAYHSQQWADSSRKSWPMGSTSKAHSSQNCAMLIAHLLQNIFQTDLGITSRTPNYYN